VGGSRLTPANHMCRGCWALRALRLTFGARLSDGLQQHRVTNCGNRFRDSFHLECPLESGDDARDRSAAPCSMISDGAALIISHDRGSPSGQRSVRFRGRAHVNDFLPMSRRDIVTFEGPAKAWQQALTEAGITIDDLDLVEVHHCFTIAEILAYEAMGLSAPGQGARAVADGITHKEGRFPVNPSGGLKAKGHPIGATGVSMHVLAAMQLCGEAGACRSKRRSWQASSIWGAPPLQLCQHSRTSELIWGSPKRTSVCSTSLPNFRLHSKRAKPKQPGASQASSVRWR
jgi:acetyl-CoA acetyltransferase